MRVYATLACLALSATSVAAQPYMDATKLAVTLGGLLGAERICGLEYDADQVREYISDHADPDDLTIASGLSIMSRGTDIEMSSMTPTEKAAQCQLAERSARALLFIQ